MAASLHHAKPILSAAINAGFRESGLQSLKNLDDPNAFPMVAIRSSGLALGSVIGFAVDDGGGNIQSLVDEHYLKMLLDLANERFEVNMKRINRFKNHVTLGGRDMEVVWEDSSARRARKKAEGLQHRDKLRTESINENSVDDR